MTMNIIGLIIGLVTFFGDWAVSSACENFKLDILCDLNHLSL